MATRSFLARPFVTTRFRVIPGAHDGGDHWLGGVPQHRGAICPVCKIPLLLLWDINCKDPRFRRGQFGSRERLPLYYCWGCVSDLSYQLIGRDRVRVFRVANGEGPHFQYEPYPSHFERRPLALVSARMPEEVLAILRKWDRVEDPLARKMGERKRALLGEYFGHPVTSGQCLFFHQFGGVPSKHWWGTERTLCPNKKCPQGVLGGRTRRAMKFLAGVLNDPWNGLPMIESRGKDAERWYNFFVTVEFQICGKCWTLYARNRGE